MLPKHRPPTHPGQMLLHEFLEPLQLTQKKFAEHIGWTYAKTSEIIHGKRGITAESALTLADAFNMEPDFWLSLQKNWDLWHAQLSHKHIVLPYTRDSSTKFLYEKRSGFKKEIEDHKNSLYIIFSFIKDGDTIIDINTYTEKYLIDFSKKFPKSTIYTFEPVNINFIYFTNFFSRKKIKNINIYNYGLSNKEEEKDLLVYTKSNSNEFEDESIKREKIKRYKCFFEVLDEKISELKIKTVDFINYTTDSSEPFALEGGEKTINKFHPAIFATLNEKICREYDYSTREIFEKIISWGYKSFEINDEKISEFNKLKLEKKDNYCFLFLNEEKHHNLISELKNDHIKR